MKKTNTKTKVIPLPTSHPKIEKGVPVPPVRKKSSDQWRFTLDMKPGDSFYLSAKQYKVPSAVHSVRQFMDYHDRKVTVRTDDGGARVWRVG